MIDKPNGKIECYVEAFIDECRYMRGEFEEIFDAGFGPLLEKKKAHPRIARMVTATVCLFFCGMVAVGFATPETVIVKTDDSRAILTTYYETTCSRVDTFIENHNIDFNPAEDVVSFDMHDGIYDDMCITIKKSYDVKVKADEQEYIHKVHPNDAGTVEEVLAAVGVILGDEDEVNFSLDERTRLDDEIIVRRVTREIVTEEETTSFNVKYVADSSLVIGDTKVEQKGRKGVKELTYEVVYVDGAQKSKTLIDTKVVKKKRDKIVHYGTRILKGTPAGLKYKKKFTKVRAVSYYYSGKPRGVYGMECEYGTCAVDRKLIPLGSLLYIEGYGYAVANDVGSAIKGKTVDVYMERLSQCGIWGARWTNVYVIEYGNDKAYWER